MTNATALNAEIAALAPGDTLRRPPGDIFLDVADPTGKTDRLLIFDTFPGSARSRVAVYVPYDLGQFEPVRAALAVCAAAYRAPQTWSPYLVSRVIDRLCQTWTQAAWEDALCQAVEDYPRYTVTQ